MVWHVFLSSGRHRGVRLPVDESRIRFEVGIWDGQAVSVAEAGTGRAWTVWQTAHKWDEEPRGRDRSRKQEVLLLSYT